MARITTYERDGLVFDVLDEGPLDGEPVVLLHGFPQRATSWRLVVPLLHEAGLRTLAPDQRGYSPGARPHRRRDYATTEMAADTVALVERLGRPVHLVGHDWGAVVGWLTADGHPDLVASLTAVSIPHPAAMAAAMRHREQLRRSWYMGLFQLPWLPERLLRTSRAEDMLRAGGMDVPMIERYRREVVADGALRGALHWYRGIPFTPRHLTRLPVTVPTTYVWSTRDAVLPRSTADRCARHVTGPYELVVLPGVTHWIPEEAPRALADAVVARACGA